MHNVTFLGEGRMPFKKDPLQLLLYCNISCLCNLIINYVMIIFGS